MITVDDIIRKKIGREYVEIKLIYINNQDDFSYWIHIMATQTETYLKSFSPYEAIFVNQYDKDDVFIFRSTCKMFKSWLKGYENVFPLPNIIDISFRNIS